MHRKNGASARRDAALDEPGIQIRSGAVNIHEHRARAAIGDGFGCGQKRIRRGNHIIAGLHSKRQQAQMQPRGPGAQRDAVLDAAEIGELALEGLDLFTLHER